MFSGIGSFSRLGAAGIAQSSSAWDPTQLPGLVAYYNAGADVIQSGGTVIAWGDGSGNNNTLLPSGTAPISSATGLNGFPGIVWNGDPTNNSLLSGVDSDFPSLTSLSVTVVFALSNPNSDANYTRILGLQASDATNDYQTLDSLGLSQDSTSSGGALFYDGSVNADGWALGPATTCWILNGTNGSPWSPYVNFVAASTSAIDQLAAIGGANTTIGIGPAGTGTSGGLLNTGVLAIGAAIITSNQLTATDMSNLKAWVNANWGTSF